MSHQTPTGQQAGDDAVAEQLRVLRDWICAELPGHDVAVRLALLTAVGGEHALLVGPAGTSRARLADRLARVLGGHLFLPPHVENAARASLVDAARTLQQFVDRAEGLRASWARVPTRSDGDAPPSIGR